MAIVRARSAVDLFAGDGGLLLRLHLASTGRLVDRWLATREMGTTVLRCYPFVGKK